jgi:EAL and modified HD-GYP domain-containing signal transduction protein
VAMRDASATPESPDRERVLLARQPLLDAAHTVVAYELLYRPIGESGAPIDPVAATASVITSALSDIGLDAVVDGRTAFLNVTRDFVLGVPALPLPPERVVLELIEDQLIDEALLTALADLSTSGFRIALDDFRYHPSQEPLLEIASIVKLDVQALDADTLARDAAALKGRGLLLVAEKVETIEEQHRCQQLGFDIYQGYYFAKPALLSRRPLPTSQLGTLYEIVQTDPGADIDALMEIIERDLGLSHRLLRFANSAAVSPASPVRSLRRALTLLGAVRIRRTAMMLSLAGMQDAPHVVLNTALLRARMCEALAQRDPHAAPDRAFTVGLFSLLDALLDRPLAELLGETPFDAAISAAVLKHAGPEGGLLAATKAYEQGDFASASVWAEPSALADAYRAAASWADSFGPQLSQ